MPPGGRHFWLSVEACEAVSLVVMVIVLAR